MDQLGDAGWRAVAMAQIDEMVTASMNHPSVIFHGFFNEGTTTKEGACVGYEEAAARVRRWAGTFDPASPRGREGTAARLVTWADNKRTKSLCLDHADVLSFNQYPGWYQSKGQLDAPRRLWSQYAAEVRSRYPLKPFTISETGAGG
eukprot:gene17157-4549_t